MRRSVTQKEIEAMKLYVTGTVTEAWEHCLPIWLNSSWKDEPYAMGGRVNDFPAGLRRCSYLPSRETVLGHLFVERFAADYLFLLERFTHGTSAEQLCAFDLLEFFARDFGRDSPLPIQLRNSQLVLPDTIRAELEDDSNYCEGLRSYTLGEFLIFMQNGGG